MKLQDLVEMRGVSPTLAEVQKQYAGSRALDASKVNALAPNEEYPAPWTIGGSADGPVSIYAANGEEVATYLAPHVAEQVLQEVQ